MFFYWRITNNPEDIFAHPYWLETKEKLINSG